MHFLITGHTGFKGAWLSLFLHMRGHTVSGVALDPERDSLFVRANVKKFLESDVRCDIRDLSKIRSHFKEIKPDVVIHLAAQALVRESYKNPLDTYETNVMGTLNILKASQQVSDLKAQLIITTDKVYKNIGKQSGYSEMEALGGHDPYSASKAMADIAVQSWLASFANPSTAIARAGNIVGGGDVCTDRLIPDLIHSYSNGLSPKLRAPNSVRPWQHVLDCLNGYLILIDRVIDGTADGAWNFGPSENQSNTVADVANMAKSIWGSHKEWELDLEDHPHEAARLVLNTEKARSQLDWGEKLSFEESIHWTINWYKNVDKGIDPLQETIQNIKDFEDR
jgi:CDP-glucose 4,6-dehydratase